MAIKILIVEDDVNACTTLANIISEDGYEAIKAATGKEAVDKAKKEKPNIVLVDTRLPDIDGNIVCRQIKAIEGLNAKVVVYTGYIDAVDAEKARAAGADDYVVKTTDYSLLIEAIKKLA